MLFFYKFLFRCALSLALLAAGVVGAIYVIQPQLFTVSSLMTHQSSELNLEEIKNEFELELVTDTYEADYTVTIDPQYQAGPWTFQLPQNAEVFVYHAVVTGTGSIDLKNLTPSDARVDGQTLYLRLLRPTAEYFLDVERSNVSLHQKQFLVRVQDLADSSDQQSDELFMAAQKDAIAAAKRELNSRIIARAEEQAWLQLSRLLRQRGIARLVIDWY